MTNDLLQVLLAKPIVCNACWRRCRNGNNPATFFAPKKNRAAVMKYSVGHSKRDELLNFVANTVEIQCRTLEREEPLNFVDMLSIVREQGRRKGRRLIVGRPRTL